MFLFWCTALFPMQHLKASCKGLQIMLRNIQYSSSSFSYSYIILCLLSLSGQWPRSIHGYYSGHTVPDLLHGFLRSFGLRTCHWTLLAVPLKHCALISWLYVQWVFVVSILVSTMACPLSCPRILSRYWNDRNSSQRLFSMSMNLTRRGIISLLCEVTSWCYCIVKLCLLLVLYFMH